MTQKKTKLAAIAVALLISTVASGYTLSQAGNDSSPPSPPPPATVNPPKTSLPSFNKSLHSTDDPGSPWVVINKKRPLPADFVPKLSPVGGANLQPDAVQALGQLMKASSNAQVTLKVISAYRSYGAQQSLYNSYVQKDGQAEADTYSARPGHSEHQTGLATDLGNSSGQCDLEICFATTSGGTWLAANAHTYGFIIRYTKDKTAVTGYQYEPWHIRYVGVELARELHASAQTMEEFFGLPAAPGY